MVRCVYDYANSCTCAEDDKCGCDFDNNMAHDVACDLSAQKSDKQTDDKAQNQSQKKNQSKKY